MSTCYECTRYDNPPNPPAGTDVQFVELRHGWGRTASRWYARRHLCAVHRAGLRGSWRYVVKPKKTPSKRAIVKAFNHDF
jgi:hypothetical protein